MSRGGHMNPLFCKLPDGRTINLAYVTQIVWKDERKTLIFYMANNEYIPLKYPDKEEADGLMDRINAFVSSWRHK